MSELNHTQEMVQEYARRVQRVDEEITGLNEDKKEIFAEAKANGLNAKVLKKAIAEIRKAKKSNPADQSELEIYQGLIENIVQPLN